MDMNQKNKNREKLLAPRSIAVLGASQKPGIGRAIVENLLLKDFAGGIYAVNVRGEDVGTVRGYRSVLDIPGEVDAAVMAVPSRFVLSVAEECGQKGVKALVCIAAGFKEVGGEGAEAEKRLLEIVEKYHMCLIGPNCAGLVNNAPEVRLNCTINPNPPAVGNVAMLTQSGALGAALMDFAKTLNIGFSVYVSTGNQADMNVCDFLELLEKDPYTKVVLLYLEGIREPERFRRIVRGMSKPVVALKSGRTGAGAKAAGSHTGSLAGSDEVADSILRQAGCIRARSLEDAFLLTMTLSKIDRPKGKRVGIVSNTGGIGILMVDALAERGFEMPALPQKYVEELTPLLLPEASVRNPMDLVAPARPEHYELAVRAMIESGEYDALIVTVVPPATVDTGKVAAAIGPLLKNSPIPAMTCFYGPGVSAAGKREIQRHGVLSFDFPEKMAEMLEYLQPVARPEVEDVALSFDEADMAGLEALLASAGADGFLPMRPAEELMRRFGIPTVRSGYIQTAADIGGLDLAYPVVAKIDHPDIIHKSDVGGVRLNVGTREELAEVLTAWEDKFAGLRGVFVQEQVRGSIELIAGATKDAALGHAVLAGMGGTLVEVLKDVSFGHVPVSAADAEEMLRRLKCYQLLEGYRGSSGVDIPQLREIIVRLSAMLQRLPQICELDVNPLIYDGSRGGFVAVDFRVRIEKPKRTICTAYA